MSSFTCPPSTYSFYAPLVVFLIIIVVVPVILNPNAICKLAVVYVKEWIVYLLF